MQDERYVRVWYRGAAVAEIHRKCWTKALDGFVQGRPCLSAGNAVGESESAIQSIRKWERRDLGGLRVDLDHVDSDRDVVEDCDPFAGLRREHPCYCATCCQDRP
jgi:hypothetical protein